MRVLTITSLFPRATDPSHGVFVLQRVKALAEAGAKVRVVSPLPWVPRGPLPERYVRLRKTPVEEKVRGLTVRHPRYRMLPLVGARWQARGYQKGVLPTVREEVERFKPDILDVHYLYPDGVAVGRIAAEVGLPYVLSARGSDVKVIARIPSLRLQIEEALERAAAVIAVSDDLAAEMRETKIHTGPIEVIPNGVDAEVFRPLDRAEARRELSIDPADRFVVCVGRLTAVRGQALLIEALASAKAPAGLRAFFVGEGPDEKSLKRSVARLGLGDRVRFVGTQDLSRIPLWLAAADGAVQLLSSAGSPNAVLEAVACRAPLLASDIPAVREALPDPERAVLVELEPAAVARGLGQLLDAPPEPYAGPVRPWTEVAEEVLGVFRRVMDDR